MKNQYNMKNKTLVFGFCGLSIEFNCKFDVAHNPQRLWLATRVQCYPYDHFC